MLLTLILIELWCVCLRQVLQMLEGRLKLLSGETGLSVEHKIAEVQESVRKAKVGVVETLQGR